MRPQKPKGRNRKIENRWKGYFLDDIDCKYCVNFRGTKRGCALSKCNFEDEKLDAIKHGRIKRKGDDVI
jgi:hypothetical protein